MKIVRTSSLIATGGVAAVMGGVAGFLAAEVGALGLLASTAIGLIGALTVAALGLRTPLRRWRLAQAPLPDDARTWLATHVPLYRRLDANGQARFERDVQFVLHEYTFEGVQDVTVTNALRWGVAAGIAMLLHGRPSWELPGTRSVLFYPDRFDDDYFGGTYADYDGMAHEQGPIIVTAPAVLESWHDPTDGNNVVLHELAHLLDFDNTGPDGVPSLVDPGSAASWQDLVRTEMRRIEYGNSILRPYAAEAPSEFFAVAVEHFFEEPDRLAQHHNTLFQALVNVFRLDPRTGQVGATAEGERG